MAKMAAPGGKSFPVKRNNNSHSRLRTCIYPARETFPEERGSLLHANGTFLLCSGKIRIIGIK